MDNKLTKSQINELLDLRVGRFWVKRDLFESKPELMMKIFGKMLIFRAEFLYSQNVFEYVAVSKLFKKKKETDGLIPFYEIIIIEDEIRAEISHEDQIGNNL